MSRRYLLAAAVPFLLAAASAPVTPEKEPIDSEIDRARAEAKAAEADVKRFEDAAAKARGEAAKLAAERQAAAAAIAASEADISAADAQLRLANALVAARAQTLAKRQAPIASLLAGIVSMGRRPPLLAIADTASINELVRVRALLDTTMPLIRQRSLALAAELDESRKLQSSAASARQQLAASRRRLEERRERFAALEARATEQAVRLGAGAVGAGDVLVASSEGEARLLDEAQRRQAAFQLASELGGLPPSVPRPGTGPRFAPPLDYLLPVAAPVSEGMGAISDTGIRSRGLTLRAYAGQKVIAPADGTVVFAGPYRRHDGVVIIDHGHGWMTLMTGVRTDLAKGERVSAGESLGRALGPMTVELSTNGTPFSAALIARSSQTVSKTPKSG